MQIIEIEFPKKTLCEQEFMQIDYCDAFEIVGKINFKSVNEFAYTYFLNQPFWLRIISQNVFSKNKIKQDILNNSFEINSKVGSWTVCNKSENEIVFGENLGFMKYRFAFLILNNTTTVLTIVKLNSIFAKYYFNVVKLLHKQFVKISLLQIKPT